MNNISENLWNSLASAERETAQPVVPGEVVPWARAVRGRLEEAAFVWAASGDERQAVERRIVGDDPAQAARVRDAKESEARLRARLEALFDRLGRLREAERKSSGSEEPLAAARELRRDILAWIVDVRALGAKLGTWRVEASHRDRGEV
jgi:hypothetical protein